MSNRRVGWDSKKQTWYCCSPTKDGVGNCTKPTGEEFVAPSPSELSTGYPVSTGHVQASTAPETKVLPTQNSSTLDGSPSRTTVSEIQPKSSTVAQRATPSSYGGTSDQAGSGQKHDDSLAIGLSVGIGLPGTLGSIAGAWFTWLAIRKKRAKNRDDAPEKPTNNQDNTDTATSTVNP